MACQVKTPRKKLRKCDLATKIFNPIIRQFVEKIFFQNQHYMILKISDFFIGTFSGALVAKAVSYISPSFMPMLAGGLIGMTIALILKVALMPVFGAFEVMIPVSIIGMIVGMSSGMLYNIVASNIVITSGALTGFIVATIIHFSNKNLTTI